MATFTNRATIAWGDTVRDSNVVTGEIVEVLSMTKNAARGTYLPGDTVTYIISIRNSDYAWMEKQIDWRLTDTTEAEARAVNAVATFPAGVGRKRQETL